ncbi:MAG: helix-turn-helix transcriptional regulator [Chitinophagaceae bacterium]|nr:helix-turn-helix transcriptional regulator [Chitinophagaceae bacterium]
MRKVSSTNYTNQKAITEGCPITSTMTMIGGRWKLAIIWHLRNGALRYNEIMKSIPGISEKMLIQQLKELIKSGWVIKKDFREIPPRTEYRLTKTGESFTPILKSIYSWGMKNNIMEATK